MSPARLLFPGLAILTSASAQIAALVPLAPVTLAPAQPIVWNMAGDLIQPRFAHTATLLINGKVMIYGGYTSGRADQLTALRSSELFDPVTRTWGQPTSAFYARVGHQATMLTTGGIHLPTSLAAHSVNQTISSQIANHISSTPPTLASVYSSAPTSSGIRRSRTTGTM